MKTYLIASELYAAISSYMSQGRKVRAAQLLYKAGMPLISAKRYLDIVEVELSKK